MINLPNLLISPNLHSSQTSPISSIPPQQLSGAFAKMDAALSGGKVADKKNFHKGSVIKGLNKKKKGSRNIRVFGDGSKGEMDVEGEEGGNGDDNDDDSASDLENNDEDDSDMELDEEDVLRAKDNRKLLFGMSKEEKRKNITHSRDVKIKRRQDRMERKNIVQVYGRDKDDRKILRDKKKKRALGGALGKSALLRAKRKAALKALKRQKISSGGTGASSSSSKEVKME
jgi:hypothetical protein